MGAAFSNSSLSEESSEIMYPISFGRCFSMEGGGVVSIGNAKQRWVSVFRIRFVFSC